MFLSNPFKSFLTVIIVLTFSAGCGFWRNNQNTIAPLFSETKSAFPFSAIEPETFQCEIVVTAGGQVQKSFLAKKGDKRRTDYNFGTEDQHSYLQIDKNYVISYRKKIYAEVEGTQGQSTMEGPWDELNSRMLNEYNNSKIEEIAPEGNLHIYRATNGESNLSEMLIYIDPAISIPVKQEFFSISDAQKTLQYAVEFMNLKLDVEDSLFEVPKDLRKVSAGEFYKTYTFGALGGREQK